ncbi:MAG: sugar ABC transporter ATP-binding protein [Bacteroidetes bacterium]|nr:sugar ABC transporter ATP-binding protein [Bacteroidota bacterium]
MSLLTTSGLSKAFPGVQALQAIDFDLLLGEVHCLVGENGAGKSTLIKVLSGVLGPDEGTITLDGRPVRFASPFEALTSGIATIYQESNLVPELSVAENILLGREPLRRGLPLLDRSSMRERSIQALQQVGESIDPGLPTRELTPSQHQMVEIAKALSRDARIVILDEPTAALTDRETATLFDLIRRLSAQGIAFIYISHRLEEIAAIGSRITVLRDGRKIGTVPASTGRDALIRMMVGRELLPSSAPPPPCEAAPLLLVDHLSSLDIHDCSFVVRKGEVLGIAGLAGAGRTELARCLFGADARTEGAVTLDGEPFRPTSPAEAIDAGVAFLTEDRNRLGLFLQRPIRENITVTSLDQDRRNGLIDRRRESLRAKALADRFGTRYADLEFDVDTLSGGNRQKVLLARALARPPRLVIVDEPTAGIDVGAKQEIHDELRRLAASGIGVIVISSDLPELLSLCSRILVMRSRTIVASLDRSEATEERILDLCMHAALY